MIKNYCIFISKNINFFFVFFETRSICWKNQCRKSINDKEWKELKRFLKWHTLCVCVERMRNSKCFKHYSISKNNPIQLRITYVAHAMSSQKHTYSRIRWILSILQSVESWWNLVPVLDGNESSIIDVGSV